MNKTTQLLTVTLAVFVLTACHKTPHPSELGLSRSQSLEFSSYEVDNTQAESLKNVINLMMYSSKDQPPVGRVFVSPGGNRLLVSAPPRFQQGVKHVLNELKTAGMVDPSVIENTFWVVLGTPSDQPSSNFPKDVAPALREIQNQRGNMKFHVMDRLVTSSLSATKSRVDSTFTEVKVVSNQVAGQVVLDLKIMMRKWDVGQLQTQLRTPVDKFVVLGQSSLEARKLPKAALGEFSNETTLDLYYIAKSRVK